MPYKPTTASGKKAATPHGPAANRSAESNALVLMRQHSMHFSEADANDNGELDFEEFMASIPAHVRAKETEETMGRWFAMLDIDGSGTVSRDEFMRWSLNAAMSASGAGVEKVFARYDRDGSGQLSELEFARAARDMGVGDRAEDIFRSLPGSENGAISYLELLDAAREQKLCARAQRLCSNLGSPNVD